jgi:hypothetical protein
MEGNGLFNEMKKMIWKNNTIKPEKDISLLFMDNKGVFHRGDYEDGWFFVQKDGCSSCSGLFLKSIDISEVKKWVYLEDLRNELMD